jgi:pimeloyl-ACP methyl ester carboxylesterase
VQQRFTAPEKYNLWPQARLHTQWIGTGFAGDENFDQFFAWQVPFVQKPEVTQALNRDALVALIDKLGPVVVMVHSQSGAYGLLASDQRPQLVKALIVVEGAAPTVHDIELIGAPEWFRDGPAARPWGVSAIPITYARFLDTLGVFAEFETSLRRERQLEGIAKAKAAGVYKGRPPSIDTARCAQ